MTKTVPQSPIDDASLIVRCTRGDRASREILARDCLPFVRKLVYLGYGHHEDSDDVVQKALVATFRDLSELRDSGAFRSWMYRVTANVIATHGGRRSRWRSIFSFEPLLDEQMVSPVGSPEKETARAMLFERMSLHLNRLKYKKRMAVTLSLFFGCVDSEIGEMMGCSSETAKKRVQHGRREFVRAVRKDPQCWELKEEVSI